MSRTNSAGSRSVSTISVIWGAPPSAFCTLSINSPLKRTGLAESLTICSTLSKRPSISTYCARRNTSLSSPRTSSTWRSNSSITSAQGELTIASFTKGTSITVSPRTSVCWPVGMTSASPNWTDATSGDTSLTSKAWLFSSPVRMSDLPDLSIVALTSTAELSFTLRLSSLSNRAHGSPSTSAIVAPFRVIL